MTSSVVRKVLSIAAATGFLMACGGGATNTATTTTTTPPPSSGNTTATTTATVTTPPPPAGFQPTAEDQAAWDHARTILDPNARANFGGTDVSSGFAPDPWAGPLTAGGGRNPINIQDLAMKDETTGEPCTQSFVTKSPDFHFNFTASELPLVRFYVVTEDNSDATLVINEPNGKWRCNDDHGKSDWGHPDAPVVDFHQPPSGRYDIWVGSFDGSRGHRAKLYVTEIDSNHP